MMRLKIVGMRTSVAVGTTRSGRVDEAGAVDGGHRERVRLATGLGTVAVADRAGDGLELGAGRRARRRIRRSRRR